MPGDCPGRGWAVLELTGTLLSKWRENNQNFGGCSWTNKITRYFPIGLQIFQSSNGQKKNPRPHLLTLGYYQLLLLKISKGTSFSRDLNRLECCIFHVIFELRNLAKILFNSFEEFLETPGVLVREREFSRQKNNENLKVMRLSVACIRAAEAKKYQFLKNT